MLAVEYNTLKVDRKSIFHKQKCTPVLLLTTPKPQLLVKNILGSAENVVSEQQENGIDCWLMQLLAFNCCKIHREVFKTTAKGGILCKFSAK